MAKAKYYTKPEIEAKGGASLAELLESGRARWCRTKRGERLYELVEAPAEVKSKTSKRAPASSPAKSKKSKRVKKKK